MSKTYFRNGEHKNRFLAALQQHHKVDPDGTIDREYAAAYYILSAHLAIWERASAYMERGIRFEDLLREIDFSHGDALLVQLAGNLFGANVENQTGQLVPMAVTPVELINTLDEGNYALALQAMDIRRSGIRISDFQEDKP